MTGGIGRETRRKEEGDRRKEEEERRKSVRRMRSATFFVLHPASCLLAPGS
jgi:hypothetical protein